VHIPDKKTWLFKISPSYRKPKAWVWYGIITPEFVVEYNPDLPKINYTGNYVVPWHDLAYEHVWYLEENKEKIWAVKARAVEHVVGVKDMGNLLLDIAQLDVVFISYDEPNAEENWQRVLEKAPHAKRVDGVTGIFEAHKVAAKLAKTDMFYVVDGDAYLVDEWQFDYQPEIFDRDCAYVWHSKNPINDLEYGYGGVKLFPRRAFNKIKVWKTLDLLTTIVPKLKVIDKVSNITAFNTDEFATWRSAFRETIKLCQTIAQDPNNTQAIDRLSAWETLGADRPFGNYAQSAVNHAREFFDENNNNVPTLQQINNRSWLHTMFNSKKITAFDYTPIKIVKNAEIVAVVTNTNTICAVPWMHLAFEPSGKVIPCCLTSVHNYFAGDLTHQSIEEIWNSGNMKTLRKDMIEGKEPEICRKCFDRERVTGESGRFYHNRDFPEVLEKIPKITLKDGTCTTMELKYWDFRFSNLCNFKCRSCGPRYSSAWVPDAKKLGLTDQEKIWNIDSVDDKNNFDFLKDQIDHVERIYFAGGEPLLMPEHWQILEMLVEKQRFDVKLSYNTNASVLSYNKKNVIDYWRQWNFGKLEIWPSIDEIGERAELIRAGTIWSKVESNLKELMTLDNAIIRPGITVGAWNVGRFPEIIKHLISIGVIRRHPKTEFINYNNFFINLLEHPSHYHVSILPDDYRAETVIKLETFVKEHNETYNTSIDHLLTHIIHELKKPFDLESAKKFVTVTDRLDTLRGENTYEVIPEMNLVLEATRNNEHGQD
jgi:radical SAM protein with 4Fe4S-binding SPASM domain